MPDEKILIFICRAQSRRDIDALSATGELEMVKAVRKCRRLELTSENCQILTSPTTEEKNSAKFLAGELNLDEPVIIPWLNDRNCQTHIITTGFLNFSTKPKILIVVEKPIMIKIVAFFDLPSHMIYSGDVFLLRYPHGTLQVL